MPNMMVLGEVPLGKGLGREGGDLLNGLSAL